MLTGSTSADDALALLLGKAPADPGSRAPQARKDDRPYVRPASRCVTCNLLHMGCCSYGLWADGGYRTFGPFCLACGEAFFEEREGNDGASTLFDL